MTKHTLSVSQSQQGSLKERIAQVIEGDHDALLHKYGEALKKHRMYRANLEVLKKDEKVVLARVRTRIKEENPKYTVAQIDDIAYSSEAYRVWLDEFATATAEEGAWNSMVAYMAEALQYNVMLISYSRTEAQQGL